MDKTGIADLNLASLGVTVMALDSSSGSPNRTKLYNVQIAGNTPTQQEMVEIKEWLESQRQPVQTTTPAVETTPAEDEPGFFESTAGAGIDQIQASVWLCRRRCW